MQNSIKTGKSVFIDVLAHVSGDVSLGDGASVWPCASVRGDRDKIVIGAHSNVQDSATLHCEKGTPVELGEYVTVGHNAIVHGAKVGDCCIIGMGAIVLDGAVIGEGSIVGAGAVIGGRKVIPPHSVVVGNPFKVLRETTEADRAAAKVNAEEYEREAAELFCGKIN